MSEKPISPLRQRMIEDMSVRNFGEKTRNDYIRHVRTFTAFLGRSPDTATAEDLRRFQLHQSKTGVRPPTINGSVAALRFFFTVTLGRANVARHLTLVREPRKMPLVLSLDEIARLLEAAPGPKYKAALSAAYGAGLRVSEVVALKVSDVDSKRMLLRIEQGKGQKDRFAMLSPVRTRSGARLSLTLHPPRRHLQPPTDCCQRERRHLQIQGLPDQRARPLQDHDAGDPRIHPPFPSSCPTQRVPSHPPLRALCQHLSC